MLDRRYLPRFIVNRIPDTYLDILETYTSFFVTGVTGVLLNVSLTWTLTEYVFGRQFYFYAYLIGLSLNLSYNFLRHAFVTFNTFSDIGRRFASFIGYSLIMAFLQSVVVRELVEVFGTEYYLVIISTVIGVFSTATFIVCNMWLFAET